MDSRSVAFPTQTTNTRETYRVETMKRPRTSLSCGRQCALTAAILVLFLACCSDAFQMNRIATRRPSTSLDDRISRSHSEDNRRTFLQHASIAAAALLTRPLSSRAASETPTFTRQSDKYGYTFQPPPSLTEGNKPLKTHLDEVNFFGPNGYQFGITIDPVRINSLAEFGTPAELAAKVVLAEVNRDGVFNVKLLQDPIAAKQQDTIDYVQLDYLSEGKRGNKRFVCKFMIYKNMLYALTAQCKENEYEALSQELLQGVDSFQVIV